MTFSEGLAAILGLKSGPIYVTEFFEVKKEVTVPNSSTHAVFSISCNGLHPDNYSKGFTYSHVGTKLIMTTWEYGVLKK